MLLLGVVSGAVSISGVTYGLYRRSKRLKNEMEEKLKDMENGLVFTISRTQENFYKNPDLAEYYDHLAKILRIASHNKTPNISLSRNLDFHIAINSIYFNYMANDGKRLEKYSNIISDLSVTSKYIYYILKGFTKDSEILVENKWIINAEYSTYTKLVLKGKDRELFLFLDEISEYVKTYRKKLDIIYANYSKLSLKENKHEVENKIAESMKEYFKEYKRILAKCGLNEDDFKFFLVTDILEVDFTKIFTKEIIKNRYDNIKRSESANNIMESTEKSPYKSDKKAIDNINKTLK